MKIKKCNNDRVEKVNENVTTVNKRETLSMDNNGPHVHFTMIQEMKLVN